MNQQQNKQSGAALPTAEKMKMRKSAYVKLAMIILFLLIVAVFSSIAWFTMNREVEGSGTQLTASDLPFEVKVSSPNTNSPDYSALLQSKFSYDVTHLETGGNIGCIKCLMNDATADPANPMRGMQPGSHGTITFQIKPKTTGTYTLHFDMKTVGYHAEFETNELGALLPDHILTKTVNGEQVPVFYSLSDYAAMQSAEVTRLEAKAAQQTLSQDEQAALANAREDRTNCPKATRFLQGHILFFENQNATTGCYSGFIDPQTGFDREYTFTAADVAGTSNAARQEELTVTLYWIWPNTFGQIVLDNGDTNLNERDAAMFSSTQTADPDTGLTPRAEMTGYIAGHIGNFFESTNTMFSDTVDAETGDVTQTAEAKITAAINGLQSNPDNIIPLGNGYNNADQIIGENIQILFAEITASIP